VKDEREEKLLIAFSSPFFFSIPFFRSSFFNNAYVHNNRNLTYITSFLHRLAHSFYLLFLFSLFSFLLFSSFITQTGVS